MDIKRGTPMLTIAQAAARLGLSPSTLRNQIQAGRLHGQLVGKTWTVTEVEVERYRLESAGQVGRPQAPTDAEAELHAMLSKLPALALTNIFIERVAEDLPVPAAGQAITLGVLAPLGQRAKSLYANFVYSLGSPAEIGPVLAIRPLVELGILVKWMALDPELHGFLYVADSDAAEVAHMANVREHARDRGSSIPVAPDDPTPKKEATRDAAFAKLNELGRNYGKDRILPNLRRMANEVITKYPGHKIVMNDAYVYAYKTFSPWEHTDASSFSATDSADGQDGWEWVGDKSPWHPEDIEAIATMIYAFIVETIFEATGDQENALLARRIRDHVFLNYVRSDAVQPVADKPEASESQ